MHIIIYREICREQKIANFSKKRGFIPLTQTELSTIMNKKVHRTIYSMYINDGDVRRIFFALARKTTIEGYLKKSFLTLRFEQNYTIISEKLNCFEISIAKKQVILTNAPPQLAAQRQTSLRR